MAGTAFLPWEKWIAQLLHPIYVAIRRQLSRQERHRRLSRSEAWPQAEGVISSVEWDSSLPRERLWYSYSTNDGYFSGSYWNWFERATAREVKAGNKIVLRYSPVDPSNSVFVELSPSDEIRESLRTP